MAFNNPAGRMGCPGNMLLLFQHQAERLDGIMYITQCKNGDCGRLFQVNEFSASAIPATGGTPLLITCPHCRLSCAGSEDCLYLTHPLSAEEETSIIGASNEAMQGAPYASSPGRAD